MPNHFRGRNYIYIYGGGLSTSLILRLKKSKVSTRDSHCAGVLKKAKATSGRHKMCLCRPWICSFLKEDNRSQKAEKSKH
jgi:hypothetical protein